MHDLRHAPGATCCASVCRLMWRGFAAWMCGVLGHALQRWSCVRSSCLSWLLYVRVLLWMRTAGSWRCRGVAMPGVGWRRCGGEALKPGRRKGGAQRCEWPWRMPHLLAARRSYCRQRTEGTGGAGAHETSLVNPISECHWDTSEASACPFTCLVWWPPIGVRPSAAVLRKKVSSGTVRYSFLSPKLGPLCGPEKGSTKWPQKQARAPIHDL